MQTLKTLNKTASSAWQPACGIVAGCANNYTGTRKHTIAQTVYVGGNKLTPITIALSVNNKLGTINATVYGYANGVAVCLLFAAGKVCPVKLSYACRAAAKLSTSPN